jgi:hypothetical protein
MHRKGTARNTREILRDLRDVAASESEISSELVRGSDAFGRHVQVPRNRVVNNVVEGIVPGELGSHDESTLRRAGSSP